MVQRETMLAPDGAFEHMSEGYAVFDKDLRYIYANGTAAGMAGLRREDLVGKTIHEAFAGKVDPSVFSCFCRVLESGVKEETEYFSPVAGRWIRLRVVPSGNGVAAYIADVSAQKQYEESACYLEMLTHSIREALISIDKDLRVVSWNAGAEALYGWNASEAIGKTVLDILRTEFPGRESEIRKNIMSALVEHGWWQGEVKQYTRSGECLDILADVSVLKNRDGDITGVVSLNRDVTRRKKSEEAELQLAALVESSDDAIISKDLNGIVKRWNPAAERIFGYTAREAIGRHILFLIPPELQFEEEQIITRIRKGIPIHHYDTERLTKDGRRVSISLTISPIRDAKGVIVGASTIGRDITEKKKADHILRDSEERLRAMFSQSGVGMCLVGIDCAIQEVNPKFCEITGYAETELVGISCLQITHPDDHPANKQILNELQSGNSETATFEKRYIRKNGSLVWVRMTMAKIRDRNKVVRQYTAIVEDISERKHAEAGLRESESRFRILAENIQSLAWMANPDGWIFWCNQRWYEYMGRSFEAIKGWGWESTLHPDHSARVHAFLSGAWKRGEPWDLTFPLKGKDGTYRWFLTNAFPVRGSNGEVIRWIGTCTDIHYVRNHGLNIEQESVQEAKA